MQFWRGQSTWKFDSQVMGKAVGEILTEKHQRVIFGYIRNGFCYIRYIFI